MRSNDDIPRDERFEQLINAIHLRLRKPPENKTFEFGEKYSGKKSGEASDIITLFEKYKNIPIFAPAYYTISYEKNHSNAIKLMREYLELGSELDVNELMSPIIEYTKEPWSKEIFKDNIINFIRDVLPIIMEPKMKTAFEDIGIKYAVPVVDLENEESGLGDFSIYIEFGSEVIDYSLFEGSIDSITRVKLLKISEEIRKSTNESAADDIKLTEKELMYRKDFGNQNEETRSDMPKISKNLELELQMYRAKLENISQIIQIANRGNLNARNPEMVVT